MAVSLTLGAAPTYGTDLHATVSTDQSAKAGTVSMVWQRPGQADVEVASGSEGGFAIATAPRFVPAQTYYLRAKVTKTDGTTGVSDQVGFTVNPITSMPQFTGTLTKAPGAIKVKVLAAGPTAIVPTGTVRLDAGSTNLGQVGLNAQGVASFEDIQPGTYNLVATYAGNGIYSAGTAAATVQVLPMTSDFQTELSTTSVVQGGPVSLHVVPVGGSAQHPASGTWDFSAVPAAGGDRVHIVSWIGSGVPFDLDLTDWARTHVGTWTLGLEYSGNAWLDDSADLAFGTLAVTAPVVNPGTGPGAGDGAGQSGPTPQAGTGKSAVSVTGRLRRAGRGIHLTIAVTGPSTPTGTVQIRDGKRLVRTVTLSAGRAVVQLRGLRKGRHTLTASYLGSATLLAGQRSWTVRIR